MAGLPLSELGAQLGLPVEGDPDLVVTGVATLEEAGPEQLVFVRSAQFAALLVDSRARAVVALEGLDVGERSVLRSPDPGRDFFRAARLLVPAPEPQPGVHPSAVVAEDAELDPSASVAAGCVVGRGVRIGARTVLHPGVVLYDGVQLGEDCELGARSVVAAASVLGDRVRLQPGAVIGGDGFGLTGAEGGGFVRTHDVGRVWLEDDVEIGANSTVDRGTLGDTRIGRGTKIDNLVHIGHNVVVGEDCIMAAMVGVAGSTRLGDRVVLMGQSGVVDHVHVGDGVLAGPKTGVTRSVPAGTRVMGFPARPEKSFHHESAALKRLPDLLRRVRALERRGDGVGDAE